MTAPQTPPPCPDGVTERPAAEGEMCTCGRPAFTVYQTAKFGDVPFCGVPGGGHGSAPTPAEKPSAPTAPPCPDWCRTDHTGDIRSLFHEGEKTDVFDGVRVFVQQEWDGWNNRLYPANVTIVFTIRDGGVLHIEEPRVVRELAELLSWGTDPRQAEVAPVLRQAADVLDRIGGGT